MERFVAIPTHARGAAAAYTTARLPPTAGWRSAHTCTIGATAAIRDIAPTIEAAGPTLGLLTLEPEIDSKGRVVGGMAWPQLRLNMNRVLGVGERA